MSVATITSFAELLRFKKAADLSVVYFGALADPRAKQYLSAFTQVCTMHSASLGGAAFGVLDVDECGDDDRDDDADHSGGPFGCGDSGAVAVTPAYPAATSRETRRVLSAA